tara:strand:+ start:148 stop:489 length:342 start_codon:yes stop_codon:yes gene_type:complete
MNNLSELNNILFDTLRDVQEDKIDSKKATNITNLSNTIINSAKTQLAAYKATKGQAYGKTFGLLSDPADTKKNKHELMYHHAQELGYKSVADAIKELNPEGFKKSFQKSIEKN